VVKVITCLNLTMLKMKNAESASSTLALAGMRQAVE
jgi:hypothetical protein